VDPVVSVHIADLRLGDALRVLRRAPRPGSIAGLRHADVGSAAPLGPSVLPRPSFRRAALLAFWDDAPAAERFAAEHELAARFRGGWHARLRPLRAFGAWPGLPDDLERGRRTTYDGPTVVLTLGRLHPTRIVRFLRTAAPASGAAASADGFVWGTGLARPPFFATCSLWASASAAAAYAYGGERPHQQAIDVDKAKPFHRRSAFVRFQPLHTEGGLAGTNPLAASVFSPSD
jgi:hypothetical protein